MYQTKQHQHTNATMPDPRWKDLFRIGAIVHFALAGMIVLAVVAYFIWPYTPGVSGIEEIFELLQSDKLAGLMSLDFVMVIFLPMMTLQFLALYAALKQVNESFALIALVFGLISNILIFTARPVLEMVTLSNHYAAATSETARSQLLAAGETYSMLFDGSAWFWWNILTGVSYIFSSWLMLRSRIFNRATAYLGFALIVFGMGFMLPGIGGFLSLLGTVGSVFWYILMARTFTLLGWGAM